MPIRTCIGCRRTAEQGKLLRMQLAPSGRLVFTPTERSSRGAYLCPAVACMEHALKHHALNRAFRRPVSAPGSAEELSEMAIKTYTDHLRVRTHGSGSAEGPSRARVASMLEILLAIRPAHAEARPDPDRHGPIDPVQTGLRK